MTDSNEVLFRLVAAVFFGAAIGFERQWHRNHQHKAGLQTNALVSLGSALFVSLNILTPGDTSPTRIASMVVSGIGFLCAGVIMRQGLTVMGLNTAATMWCAAGVGVLAGMSHVAQAAMGTAIVILANLVLRTVSHWLDERHGESSTSTIHYVLRVNCPESELAAIRRRMIADLAEGTLKLRSLHGVRTHAGQAEVRAEVVSRGRSDELLERLASQLGSEPGVAESGWEVVPAEESGRTMMGAGIGPFQ